nr:hypothetical protein [Streptomyces viridosporus]
MWAHIERSLANLAVVALDQLEALDGFIAGTGMTLDELASP